MALPRTGAAGKIPSVDACLILPGNGEEIDLLLLGENADVVAKGFPGGYFPYVSFIGVEVFPREQRVEQRASLGR